MKTLLLCISYMTYIICCMPPQFKMKFLTTGDLVNANFSVPNYLGWGL